MILSREEAICLVLKFAKDKKINSLMKLNKLVARLNLHFIPTAVDFSLNKWGSFDANLKDLESNKYFDKSFYVYGNKKIPLFKLKKEGEELANLTLNKVKKILKEDEIDGLRKDVFERSQLPAKELSEEEHKELLVDEEDRQELIQRINAVAVDMFDLFQEIDKISENTIGDIRLAALIEYCYHLSRYLKEKRFKNIKTEGYDFDAYMFDYYFLFLLEKEVIPLIKSQLEKKEKDGILINKYYQYFINSVKDRYPFSLENPDLFKVMAQ